MSYIPKVITYINTTDLYIIIFTICCRRDLTDHRISQKLGVYVGLPPEGIVEIMS
jgi:hypothetical protein